MITIDLQDDDVTQTRKKTRLEKDTARRERGRSVDLAPAAGEDLLRQPMKPGLIARLLNMIFKEV